jgi:hypothetical protein
MANPTDKSGDVAGQPIRLQRLKDSTSTIRVVGRTPLIPHRWSEKALQMMRDKQYGDQVKARRQPKNPEEEAHQSCYWMADGRPAMPATAFKAAMVSACRFFEGIPMTKAKAVIFVEGEGLEQLVPIEGKPVMREDTPRNATGVADLRYRMAIFPWSTTLTVRYIASELDDGSVASLLDAAGRVGVGDWRPGSPKSSTGVFGTFRVPDAGEESEAAG